MPVVPRRRRRGDLVFPTIPPTYGVLPARLGRQVPSLPRPVKSQRRIVESPPPEARVRPSGENASDQTQFCSTSNRRISCPEGSSQRRIEQISSFSPLGSVLVSISSVARVLPSGD